MPWLASGLPACRTAEELGHHIRLTDCKEGSGSLTRSESHAQQDGLGADVRVEAERKLKALETDLAMAERAKKERALATRYHKVKFLYISLGRVSHKDQIVRNSLRRMR
ncbi:hypothetical protein BC826DRAFT_914648 [Russula brevipes]|nr:hypothetical protein BC826DRAFT_914648 [Russula brevipes]